MVIRLGVFEVDFESGELRKAGTLRARLQDQPLKVLAALVERDGGLVTREELKERLWPPDVHVDHDHGIAKAVLKLRAALGDSAESPHFIATIPRRGYRLLVEAEPVMAVVGHRPTASTPRSVLFRTPSRWLGLGLAALIVIGAYLWREESVIDPIQTPMSIAVLPFRSVGPGDNQLALSLGTADTLITRLGQSTGLTVRPTSAVARFVDANVDALDAGRRLHAEAVLAGTYQRDEGRIRVSLRLLRVADGQTLWADVLDEEAPGVFELQDLVAAHVVTELSRGASRGYGLDLAVRHTANVEAYEQYLRGCHLFAQRSVPSLERAIASFERAVQLDAEFALAHAGLAMAYGPLLTLGKLDPAVGNEKLIAAAYRAFELDDSLAEVHTAVGLAHSIEWNFVEEERSYQKAIALDPGYALAHQWYGFLLRALGRHEQSLDMRRRAWELDPTELTNGLGLATSLFLAGHAEKAFARLDKTLELEPESPRALEIAGDLYAEVGEYERAQDFFRRAGNRVSVVCAKAQSGAREEARRALEEIVRRGAATEYELAAVHASLGATDEAFAFLERAYAARTSELMFLGYDWRIRPLETDPRHRELLVRIGLRSER
jgi:TolB-like protein/DNA-binding winged helix-turn-helix (wHTH) protein/Tfp pilus assembly protein PilF